MNDCRLSSSRSSRRRSSLVAACLAAALVAAFGPVQQAAAWPCRWRAAWCGPRPACVQPFAFRPWCRPDFAYGAGFGGYGIGGYGFSSYRSYTYATPGFYSSFGGPGFGGWGCGYPIYGYRACGYPFWGYRPYGCGWYFPSGFAPVFGPAGVMPYLGISSTINGSSATVASFASQPQAAGRVVAAQVNPPARPIRAAVGPAVATIRASNAIARRRAGRLLATGDGHLRNAVERPVALANALDAYRRAAAIAPDLPDTFLRQAIVLTAQGRDDDAQAAVARAVAIDARLGEDTAAAVAAADRLPPEPAFRLARNGGPTPLAARSMNLLDRIFKAEGNAGADAAGVNVNWIADRWSRQWQDQIQAVALREPR